jgi:hypothetical protein
MSEPTTAAPYADERRQAARMLAVKLRDAVTAYHDALLWWDDDDTPDADLWEATTRDARTTLEAVFADVGKTV